MSRIRDAREPALRARWLLMDGGWTLALTVFTFFGTRGSNEIRGGHTPLDLLGWALALVAPVTLIAVRRFPREVFVAETLLCAVYLARDYAGGPIWLAMIVAAAVIGWSLTLRTSLILIVGGALVEIAVGALHPDSDQRLTALLLILTWALVPVVPWALSALARLSITSARQSEAERHRQVVDGERVRIAREVHDVVGHSLAVISMQAGVALHVAQTRPQQAQVALEAIARSSRDALDELRRTLAVLRGEDDDPDTAPAPDLAALPALIADFGPHVGLHVAGDTAAVGAAVATAAYRIVQESLTNTARHAAGAPARVEVRCDAGTLTVDVINDGPMVPDADHHRGSGLAGMAERCTALGGTFRAGPRAGGGWAVRADLPLAVSGAVATR